jgi:DnaK suppressor protein
MPEKRSAAQSDAAGSDVRLQMLAVLSDARTRVLERLADISAEIDEIVQTSEAASTDDEHDPEGSTIAFERARAASLRSQAVSDLDAVEDAIHRWHNGGFGLCEKCGRAIPIERLTAIPVTKRCVMCAGLL